MFPHKFLTAAQGRLKEPSLACSIEDCVHSNSGVKNHEWRVHFHQITLLKEVSNLDRPVTFYFTRRALTLIIGYETLLVVCGIPVALVCIFSSGEVRLRGVIAGMALGAVGAAAYYARRIYRAAFDNRCKLVKQDEFGPERIGTALYLVGRPLISLALALTASLATILADTAVMPDGALPTNNLTYLTATIGFSTGFLSGRAIRDTERGAKA